MRRRLRDRLFVGAHLEGSTYWVIVAVGVVWAVVAAVRGDWSGVAEGIFGAATIVGVIWVASRSLGWSFWPWK